MTTLQSEVFSALVNQGFKPKDAHLKVAGAEGEDFPTLFNAAIQAPAIPRKVVAIDRDQKPVGRIRRAWRALRSIDREAAIDSGKNVFALLGVGAVLAYMGTMPHWMLAGAVVILVGAWYADYVRHF